MTVQEIIPDICKKADVAYQQGAKTFMLSYFLPTRMLEDFKEYCQQQRQQKNPWFLTRSSLDDKYGGIVLKATDDKKLFFVLSDMTRHIRDTLSVPL